MDDYNIGMIAIQENEGIHEEKIMYEKINYHVLSSSAFSNSTVTVTDGVAALNRTASSALCKVTSISDRIMQITFLAIQSSHLFWTPVLPEGSLVIALVHPFVSPSASPSVSALVRL